MAALISALASKCPTLLQFFASRCGMRHMAGEALLEALASNAWPNLNHLDVSSYDVTDDAFGVRLAEVLEGDAGSCIESLYRLWAGWAKDRAARGSILKGGTTHA